MFAIGVIQLTHGRKHAGAHRSVAVQRYLGEIGGAVTSELIEGIGRSIHGRTEQGSNGGICRGGRLHNTQGKVLTVVVEGEVIQWQFVASVLQHHLGFGLE
ncbi:hypothetical protein D3C84_516120 [compost metagenome]